MFKTCMAVLTVTLIAGTIPVWAGQRGRYLDGAGATSCEQMNVNFDHREVFRAQEEFTLPAGQLDVSAARNGGVSLLPGTSNQYEVKVCKFAAADNQAEADRLLGQIQAERAAGKLAIRGPENERGWAASVIVRVPKDASMKVEARNGPVSARDLNGTFDLKTMNGPISVKNVSGKVSAKATNGPISFTGDRGELNLQTNNGPISINLQNQVWQNGKLDANVQNGPISLRVPKGYQSGVVLTAKGYAPMSCSAEVCNEARKTSDDDGRRIEFGPSNPVIHISTVNGPVSVATKRSEGEL